jgi:hypothetical protein
VLGVLVEGVVAGEGLEVAVHVQQHEQPMKITAADGHQELQRDGRRGVDQAAYSVTAAQVARVADHDPRAALGAGLGVAVVQVGVAQRGSEGPGVDAGLPDRGIGDAELGDALLHPGCGDDEAVGAGTDGPAPQLGVECGDGGGLHDQRWYVEAAGVLERLAADLGGGDADQ